MEDRARNIKEEHRLQGRIMVLMQQEGVVDISEEQAARRQTTMAVVEEADQALWAAA